MPQRKRTTPLLFDEVMPLHAFVRAVEDGGFSAAARRLGLTPSAVSKQVAHLESRLGARLLRRTTHHVSLTEAGSLFYEHCRRVLSELEDAALSVTALDEHPRGLLRIAVPAVLGEVQVAAMAAAFQAAHPDVQVDLDASDRLVDLVEEGFDVAIRIADELQDSTLVVRRLAPEQRILCASPAYLQRRGTPRTPDDLMAQDCLVFKRGQGPMEWQLEVAGGRRSLRVSGPFQANNNLILRQAALQGRGIANLPVYLVRDELSAGTLVPLLPDTPVVGRGIFLVHPHRRLIPAKVRAFVEFCLQAFERLR
ncbi:LysR family transcriptional regulator [Corallococcus terminator]|uniref:LysR family transcriptional regulator n=1 Tax=Corallococcus terminator TaxID=2316733 RepID=A0A3A8JN93_9BACT|nr:LysR family transcriptional regulator [Corallococcus terminator]RKG93774.1 LysR family transcriptional regulator [Corallococcus terminator]